MVTNTNK